MRFNRTLWTIQGLLALVFVLTGTMKLMLPLDQLAGPIAFPGLFVRFLGVAEVLGALGLVLPWLLQIRPVLTPIAAGALVIIMVGAVVVTVLGGSSVGALAPALIGVALVAVAYGRTQLAAL